MILVPERKIKFHYKWLMHIKIYLFGFSLLVIK
jgi:hypothetical protein